MNGQVFVATLKEGLKALTSKQGIRSGIDHWRKTTKKQEFGLDSVRIPKAGCFLSPPVILVGLSAAIQMLKIIL